jgi:hypothetical protein
MWLLTLKINVNLLFAKILNEIKFSDARIRALAASWARKDFQLAESFLQNRDNFGLNEVLKALQLLDAGRQARVLEKKMKMLQVSKNKVKAKTLGKLKSDIDNYNKMKSPVSISYGF